MDPVSDLGTDLACHKWRTWKRCISPGGGTQGATCEQFSLFRDSHAPEQGEHLPNPPSPVPHRCLLSTETRCATGSSVAASTPCTAFNLRPGVMTYSPPNCSSQKACASEDFRWCGSGCRTERILHEGLQGRGKGQEMLGSRLRPRTSFPGSCFTIGAADGLAVTPPAKGDWRHSPSTRPMQ